MAAKSSTKQNPPVRIGRSPFTGHIILAPVVSKKASITIEQARRIANQVRAARAQS